MTWRMRAGVVQRLQRHHQLDGRAVGVGDDARGGPSAASAFTSGTTSGTCRVHAEGARLVDHHAAALRPPPARSACDVPPPAENSARSKPSSASSVSSRTSSCSPAKLDPCCRPSGPMRTAPPRRPGSRARPGSTAPRGRRRRWRRPRRRAGSGMRRPALGQLQLDLERVVQRRAPPRPPCSRAITHDTLIGEVAIMRTLMPWSASVWNMRAATPGWLFMPAPIRLTLPAVVVHPPVQAEIAAEPLDGVGHQRQVVARDRERDVGVAVGDGVLDDRVDVDVRRRRRR